MRRLALLLVSATLVFAPASAYAHGGGESASTAIPAQALAVQALAMLDAGMGVAEARGRVQAALQATDKQDVRLDRLRAADASLARNDTASAHRELESAFNTDDRHLIGTSFTNGDARPIAAILGAIIAAAGLLIYRRTRTNGTISEPPPGVNSA